MADGIRHIGNAPQQSLGNEIVGWIPKRSVQDISLDIARGNISGATPFGAYGEISTAGAVTKNVIWPDGTFNIPNQTTGADISFVSSSDDDAVGGTGIEKIEVYYLDTNLDQQQKQITLNGLTPVTGQLSGVRFIQCMHAISVGSTGAAVGEIEAYLATDDSIVYSIISSSSERCTSSMRMVPRGKRLVVLGALASSVSTTADSYAFIRIVATECEGDQYLDPFIFIPQGSIGTQNGGVSFNFPVPYIFNAGTIVGMRVTTNKSAIVSGDWFGWLEDI